MKTIGLIGGMSWESSALYYRIIHELMQQGAQAVILGCTEIGMLISSADCDIPVYDTTIIHAEAAVHFALDTESK